MAGPGLAPLTGQAREEAKSDHVLVFPDEWLCLGGAARVGRGLSDGNQDRDRVNRSDVQPLAWLPRSLTRVRPLLRSRACTALRAPSVGTTTPAPRMVISNANWRQSLAWNSTAEELKPTTSSRSAPSDARRARRMQPGRRPLRLPAVPLAPRNRGPHVDSWRQSCTFKPAVESDCLDWGRPYSKYLA
jgi:hypothetical protein